MAAFGRKNESVKTKPTNLSNSYSSNEKTSIVGKTLLVKGEMFSDEEVLVEGTIEGKLNINNRVIVGKNGVVNAAIDAQEVIIKGEVNGNVKGQFKVEIVPDGILNGNIISQRVVLAEGALFKGNIDMTPRDDKSPETVVLESSQ
jgi:cytoskeletal protein CcmA (bactofilin family)